MARAGSFANTRPDLPFQRCIENNALFKPHEQNYPHIALKHLTDCNGFQNLRNLFNLRVNLGGANANAAGVQRRVGPAMDNEPTMSRPFGKIAMLPNARKALEIGGAVFGAILIVPKPDWHRGKSLGADELALAFAQRVPLLVPHVYGHTETRTLNLPRINRRCRITQHEARHDIRAARNRGEMHAVADRLIDPSKGLSCKRGAG